MVGEYPEQLDEVEWEQLAETVDRALHFQQLDKAQQAADKLRQAVPNSTTTWELWGDVLLAQDNLEEASEAFERAVELEPANADAERKYAALQLRIGPAQWQREMLESGDLEQFRGASHKEVGTAVARSAFFPGFGQVYNGEYEKGTIMFAIALALLIPAVRLLVTWISPTQSISTVGIVLGYIGLFGYLALYIIAILDAYRFGQQAADGQPIVAPPSKTEKVD